jgi:hypothetical protein
VSDWFQSASGLRTEKAVYRKFFSRQVEPSKSDEILLSLQLGVPNSTFDAARATKIHQGLIALQAGFAPNIIKTISTIRNRAELPGFTRLASRANKLAQRGDIRTIRSDAGRIDWQAQALGSFYIDAGVIEFRQAKPNRWKHALDSAWVDWARRPVSLPRAICDCEELVPIVFVPHFSLPRLRGLKTL